VKTAARAQIALTAVLVIRPFPAKERGHRLSSSFFRSSSVARDAPRSFLSFQSHGTDAAPSGVVINFICYHPTKFRNPLPKTEKRSTKNLQKFSLPTNRGKRPAEENTFRLAQP